MQRHTKNSRWTPEIIELARTAMQTYQGVVDLAEALGISYSAVVLTAERHGLKKGFDRAPRKGCLQDRWTPEVDARIIKAAEVKGGLRSIALEMGMHLTAISRRANFLGVVSQHGRQCVVARNERDSGTRTCSLCKRSLPLSGFYIKSTGYLSFAHCKECHASLKKPTIESVLSRTRAHTKGKMPVALLFQMYDINRGKCFYTDQVMDPSNPDLRPSVDRIDSKIGYIPTNIALCCHKVNLMKNTLSINDFIGVCEMVTKKHRLSTTGGASTQ